MSPATVSSRAVIRSASSMEWESGGGAGDVGRVPLAGVAAVRVFPCDRWLASYAWTTASGSRPRSPTWWPFMSAQARISAEVDGMGGWSQSQHEDSDDVPIPSETVPASGLRPGDRVNEADTPKGPGT